MPAKEGDNGRPDSIGVGDGRRMGEAGQLDIGRCGQNLRYLAGASGERVRVEFEAP